MRRTMIFAYCDALLLLVNREMTRARFDGRPIDMRRVNDYCDRFERALAALASPPLIWHGDYA